MHKQFKKGAAAAKEYQEALEAIRKDGTDPYNWVYNPTGPNGNSGMTTPEYLRNKLDKIGYNSWDDLVRDYSSIDAKTLYILGHSIMENNWENVDPKIYDISLDVFKYIFESGISIENETRSSISRDLDQIEFQSFDNNYRDIMKKSIELNLKIHPGNKSLIKSLEELNQ